MVGFGGFNKTVDHDVIVAEQIGWSWNFNNRTFIVFWGINVYVVLIDDEGFWNDMKTPIDFIRQFFVTMRKQRC